MKRKYSKELLAPLAASSFSVAEIVRKLNKKNSGSTAGHIKKLLIEFDIDHTHFKHTSQLIKERGPSNKKSADQILILNENAFIREAPARLRRALIESGELYCCKICGILPTWQNKRLTLQIDHINGKRYDNRKENLRFLCPNCHSQTDTFGSLNRN